MSQLSDKLLSFAHSSARALVEDADDEKGGKTPSTEDVIAFLVKHPNPKDDAWHAWAEKQGYDVHKAEAVAYELATRMAVDVSTGKAMKAKYDPTTLPADVLKLGMGVEAEHSTNAETQVRIVGDHAAEFKKGGEVVPEAVRMYYEELLALEEKIKAKFGIKE